MGRKALLLLALAAAIWASGGCWGGLESQVPFPCGTSDHQCPTGFVCYNKDSTCHPDTSPECSDSTPCGGSYYCDSKGSCQPLNLRCTTAKPCQSGTCIATRDGTNCIPSCGAPLDSHCNAGYDCKLLIAGTGATEVSACAATGTTYLMGACNASSDCAAGLTCEKNSNGDYLCFKGCANPGKNNAAECTTAYPNCVWVSIFPTTWGVCSTTSN